MPETAIILSEIAVTLLKAYMLAATQAGLSLEEAKAEFEKTFNVFMAESSVPVEPVKE